MKKLIFYIGIVSLILVSTGALAKLNHWPAASIALVTGIVGLALVFTPMALINNYKKSESRSLIFYLIVFLTTALLFGSALFKILHWPGATLILMIAIPFPFVVFIPALLIESKRNKQLSLPLLIVVLFFMTYSAVSTAMLSLNISKDMLDEATLVEEELQTMNAQLQKVLDRKTDKVENVHQAIENAKLSIVQEATEAESRKALQTPFSITKKDSYQAYINAYRSKSSYFNTMVEDCRDIIFPTIDDIHKEMNIPTAVSQQYFSNYWLFIIGDNPKIWSLANLSLLQMEVLIHQNTRHNYLTIKNNP